jgi:hypothetical protein
LSADVPISGFIGFSPLGQKILVWDWVLKSRGVQELSMLLFPNLYGNYNSYHHWFFGFEHPTPARHETPTFSSEEDELFLELSFSLTFCVWSIYVSVSRKRLENSYCLLAISLL